jgi:hypothetical protein
MHEKPETFPRIDADEPLLLVIPIQPRDVPAVEAEIFDALVSKDATRSSEGYSFPAGPGEFTRGRERMDVPRPLLPLPPEQFVLVHQPENADDLVAFQDDIKFSGVVTALDPFSFRGRRIELILPVVDPFLTKPQGGGTQHIENQVDPGIFHRQDRITLRRPLR